MNISFSSSPLIELRSDCLILPIQQGSLSKQVKLIDASYGKLVSTLVKQGDVSGSIGETLLVSSAKGTASTRLLLVGVGKAKTLSASEAVSIANAISKALKGTPIKHAVLACDDITVADRDSVWLGQQLAQTISASQYSFSASKSDKPKKPALSKVTLHSDEKKTVAGLKKGAKKGSAISLGMDVARELGNLPANICTPNYLAKEAKALGRKNTKLSVKVLEEKDMLALGMGSLLSVSAGSDEPAKLIVMEYKGGKKTEKPTVLVGKGITFDTGGISLKPGAAMDEMKYDMCGAASVFGAMNSILALEPSSNIIAIVAASENMPSGRATKPGDVVTSMAGKTIEVLNTDAEGRLVLCDALTYAEKFKPKAVIDIATLTGACVIALGSHATGMYSNHQALANALLEAGQQSNDRAWQMPLWDEYTKQLKSNFADLANIGGREAGSITAACFLSEFTKNYHWAHLDIAGTAWVSGGNKGATGRPVPLLVNYLLNNA